MADTITDLVLKKLANASKEVQSVLAGLGPSGGMTRAEAEEVLRTARRRITRTIDILHEEEPPA